MHERVKMNYLTLSWRRSLSYRNQTIDLLCKSMDWFLYDSDLRHGRVKNGIKLKTDPPRTFWHTNGDRFSRFHLENLDPVFPLKATQRRPLGLPGLLVSMGLSDISEIKRIKPFYIKLFLANTKLQITFSSSLIGLSQMKSSDFKRNISRISSVEGTLYLTHCIALASFFTPWKHQKNKVFLFSGGIERGQWRERVELNNDDIIKFPSTNLP